MSEQPETESQSVEDRLMAQFEPEQPETETPEEQPAQEAAPESEAQPEFHDVEYEGKTYQVPPELKEALLRQSDYTKKTTEVADRQRALEQREFRQRAVDNERAFHDTVKPDINQIQRIDFEIEQWKAVDVTGMNAEQLMQLSRKMDQLKEKRVELSNGLTPKWQAYQQQQQQLANEAQAKYLEAIAKSVPGWNADLDAELTQYALSEGYTEDQLRGNRDPTYVKTLWKARQYDKAQAALVNGKVKIAPTVKPGSSNPMPQAVKDRFALKKTLSNPKLNSASKAKAIEAELMRRF